MFLSVVPGTYAWSSPFMMTSSIKNMESENDGLATAMSAVVSTQFRRKDDLGLG